MATIKNVRIQFFSFYQKHGGVLKPANSGSFVSYRPL